MNGLVSSARLSLFSRVGFFAMVWIAGWIVMTRPAAAVADDPALESALREGVESLLGAMEMDGAGPAAPGGLALAPAGTVLDSVEVDSGNAIVRLTVPSEVLK